MSELWENPLYPGEERLEMAVGAIQFRDKIVDSLRRQVEAQAARADRAERALIRGGYTDTAGAAEWKPPIGSNRGTSRPVYVTYMGADRLMFCSDGRDVDGKHVVTAHDGSSIVIEQGRELISVHVMTREEPVTEKLVSGASRRGVYAEGDISAIETAIIHEVGVCPSRWSGWPGARHLARAAYNAVFREVEKRQ